MESMKKLAFGILCMAAAVLLMSHNTLAVQADLDVSISYTNFNSTMYFCVEQVNQGEQVSGQCGNRYWASATSAFNYDSNIHTSASGIKFFTPTSYQVKYNDIIQLEFDLIQGTVNNSLDTGIVSFRSNTSGFQVIDISYDQVDNTTAHVKTLLWASRYEGYNSGALPIILIPSRVPSNEANNYTWNFIWLRESNAQVIGGLVNVFHLKGDSSEAIINAINNNNSSGAINDLKESIEEAQEQEQEAVDNISEQTPSDISSSGNTENQASTNLIGAFSSFVSALTNIQTGNCNITLAFPAYAGGSQTVNICQNKDKAGNLISVFSSLTLIVFYIPLAIRLLTMIYNEIRSFTNG